LQHVNDPTRGQGVELKLAPIPAGSVWLIESALASEQRHAPGAPGPATPAIRSGPVASMTDGAEITEAEAELIRALAAEAESLKKLNPFLVLGVAYEVTDAEVRAAFGELTKKYHPDRFARYESTQLRQVAAEIFILIRDAYRKLGDASGRAQVLAVVQKQAARPASTSGQQAMRRTPPQGVPVKTSDVKSGPLRTVHEAGTVRKPPEPSLLEKPTPKPGSINVHDAGTVRKPEAATTTTDKLPTAPGDTSEVDALVDAGKLEEALAAFRMLMKKHPQERVYRAGIELCEGLRAIANRDRLEAAQRFEAALEIDPSNERAARELAEMRRHATNERKGQLSRLMGKKE
ncbi:MAG: J domain-containing protein, partial [Deltaproteobacteria bacterium]|nr:J domain-containing protein [Deltaproteobacteria bacterium]